MRLGWPEILLILVVVLIVFGVGKLPQTMKDLGKGVREFRKAQEGGYDEDAKDAKEAKPTASKSSVVIESNADARGGSKQDELAATKARLEAAEAKIKELERAPKV